LQWNCVRELIRTRIRKRMYTRRKHHDGILNVQMYSYGYEYPLRKGVLNIAKHSLDLSHTNFARGYSNSMPWGWRTRPLGFIVTRFQIALDHTHAEMRIHIWARIDIKLSELYSSCWVILSGEKEEDRAQSSFRSLYIKLIADLFLK